MLKSPLIHPEIARALAAAGHGSKVLLADANYPVATTAGKNACVVYLGLCPDRPTVTEVFDVISQVVPIEAAHAIMPDRGGEPAHYDEFRDRLGDIELRLLARHAFYGAVQSDDCALVIGTGDTRLYACLLLTIGVVEPKR